MNKISPPCSTRIQALASRHHEQWRCPWRYPPSPSTPAAQGNHGHSAFLRPLKVFFSLLLSLTLAGCSDEPKLPEPPISFPFLAWKAGEKLDFQFRIKEKYFYKFSINVYYKRQGIDDHEDMERIRKLVGDYKRNSAGEIDRIGIQIPLILKVIQKNDDQEKVITNEKFHELENYSHGIKNFSKKIIFVTLEPGNYRCQIESLVDISEFAGVEMKFVLSKHHAK